MTDGTHGPQWIADEIRKAEKMTDRIDTSPEAMLKRLTFEAVNGEIDKAFAGEIGTLLRALSARAEELEAENCKLALEVISANGQALDAYDAQKSAEQRAAELEVKLAKAQVSIADLYRLHLRRGPAWDHPPTKDVMEQARATLKELTEAS